MDNTELDYRAIHRKLIGKGLEGSSSGIIEVVSLNLPGETGEKYKEHQVRTSGVPAEIQTESFQSSILDRSA
jgi:hypothetical protein